GGERYLRNEYQHLLARGEDLRDEPEVDLGLAASRDTEEQGDAEFLQAAAQRRERVRLLRGQLVRLDEAGLGRRRSENGDPARLEAALEQLPRAADGRLELGRRRRALTESREKRSQAALPGRYLRFGARGRNAISDGRFRNRSRTAQARGQRGRDDFAEGTLVVAAAEFGEIQPFAAERRGGAGGCFGRT